MSGLPLLIQSLFTNVTADTTTTSATFVDLLTQTITTGANSLELLFTISASTSSGNKNIGFQILIDGTVQRGGGLSTSSANSSISGVVSHKATVSAAAHTVKVQWLVSGGTAAINVATTPAEYHASLWVKEVPT